MNEVLRRVARRAAPAHPTVGSYLPGPMDISSEDVRQVARLARLELTDDEVERFRRELSTILDYVEQLERLEAGTAAEPSAPDQPLRGDVVEEWGEVGLLRKAAPDFVEGFFRVPRVIE